MIKTELHEWNSYDVSVCWLRGSNSMYHGAFRNRKELIKEAKRLGLFSKKLKYIIFSYGKLNINKMSSVIHYFNLSEDLINLILDFYIDKKILATHFIT